MTDAHAPLQRDRDLGRLLDDTFSLYRRHAGVALVLAAAVVIPVELLVSGVGLGQLTSGYDSEASSGELIVGGLAPVLITTPLVTGMLVRIVLDDAAGEPASAGRAAETGLNLFAPLLAAILLATLGIVLGFFALVIPGIWLAVRWVVVAPTVVVEGHRGADALRRSAALVTGSWWWAFSVMIVLAILVLVVSAVVTIPTDAIGRSADAQIIVLLGSIIGQILTLPFSALATTLLFFTLRARRGEAPAPAERDAFGGYDRPGADAAGR